MRSNILKKTTTILLILAMLFNTIFINQPVVYANEQELEKIYIDGIEYAISITEDLNVKVNTFIEGEMYSLEINKFDGSGELTSTSEDINANDYAIQIQELSESDVDLTISDNRTNEVQEIDSIDELIDESYVGQAAAAVTFGGIAGKALLAAIAAALAKAATVVVVGGVTYHAVTKISEKIRKGSYYPAIISGNNVLIAPNAINRSKAVERLKNRMSIYTILSSHAKGAVKDTHMGVTQSENHYNSGKKGVFFSHYHTLQRRGEHAFYGMPKVRK